MIGLAALFGVVAVFLAQSWINSQADARLKSLEASKRPMTMQTIVVAAKPLRYGNELAAPSLREIDWPEGGLPAGAYAKIDDVLKDGKRIVLAAIEPNEPVLAVKITGAGQRATLSAPVQPGMKAVTIRVTDVDASAALCCRANRRCSLTRQVDKETPRPRSCCRRACWRSIRLPMSAANPAVAKSATLEVDTVGAQKLSLAGSVGTLSLLLRKAGEITSERSLRVTLKDLFNDVVGDLGRGSSATITVRRGSVKEGYSVPIEDNGKRSMAAKGGDKPLN